MADIVFTGVSDTVTKGGSAAAPGAGAAFVTVAAPTQPGVYKITFSWIITGALEVAPLNVRLQVNGAAQMDLPSNVQNVMQSIVIERLTLDGVNNLQLRSIAAATASTVYGGTITLTRVQ